MLNVCRDCWWYLPVTDEWLSAPRMLKGRFEAVAVSLPGPSNGGQHPGGQVWMTGGREGSNILQKNEVLQYPALYSNTGTSPGFELKRWQWSNEKAKHTEVVDKRIEVFIIMIDMPSRYGITESGPQCMSSPFHWPVTAWLLSTTSL